MYLVHTTTLRNFEKIVKDGKLKPSSETGQRRYDVYLNEVYMSVLFDNVKISKPGSQVLIFFPVQIMERYKVLHWSPIWDYGFFDKDTGSIKYNFNMSAKNNVLRWEKQFYDINFQKMYKVFKPGSCTSAAGNEVVFGESIPLSEAAFIFIKDEKDNFIGSTKKLNQLLKVDRQS